MKRNGKVWVAGAGPGDVGLLSVKTIQLMERADVIVYDALISTEIMSLIPEDRELIYVGKRLGNHTIPQNEINEILLNKAKEGKNVLRLKGGDPFVFGRGGEELELLVKHQIPYEVVPGITAASAVPAYAGIPLTHRDYTSSFHVITGHRKRGEAPYIDYQALVKLNGTLVFLMGVSAMESICTGLMNAGMRETMPAAVLEGGTTSEQRSVISSIAYLVRDAKEADIKAPAIILVGTVCKLSKSFFWAENRPLFGKQFLITRPKEYSSKMAASLRDLGAQVIELSSITTKPIEANKILDEALLQFGKEAGEEWLVFTSPTGVRIFFEELLRRRIDLRTLLSGAADIRIAAIGEASAKALEGYGLLADLVPSNYCAGVLGKELSQEAKKGSKITIVRGTMGSDELIWPLIHAGLKVKDVPIYETLYKAHGEIKEKISNLFKENKIHGVTFTSASTVKGFLHTFPEIDRTGIHALCIGEQTAKVAKEAGMQICVSKSATIDSMVSMAVEQYGERRWQNI